MEQVFYSQHLHMILVLTAKSSSATDHAFYMQTPLVLRLVTLWPSPVLPTALAMGGLLIVISAVFS